MSDTEQQGVSPATAGGAPAPEVVAEVTAYWDRVRALVAGDPDPRVVEIERELTSILDLTPGHGITELLAVVKSRLEWRDAEIERLRVQFDGIRGALRAANILIGGTRSERDQARAEVEELETQHDDQAVGIEHWKGLAETVGAQRDDHARSIRDLVAERDRKRRELGDVTSDRDRWQANYNRLIGGALAVQQHLQRAHGQPETAVTSEYMGPDFSQSMVDGLRIDKDKADAEVTRLREKLGIPSETALRDLANRLHVIVDEEDCVRESVDEDHVVELITNVDNMLERAGADAARAIQKCLEVEAERDRLRQELDLIHEQYAAGLVTLRTDFTAAVNGLLPKPAELSGEAACRAGNEDYSELRCKRAARHEGQHEDPTQGATWSAEVATEPKGGA